MIWQKDPVQLLTASECVLPGTLNNDGKPQSDAESKRKTLFLDATLEQVQRPGSHCRLRFACGISKWGHGVVTFSSAEADPVPGSSAVVSVTQTISVDCVVVLDHQEVSSACGALLSTHQRFMAIDYLVTSAGALCGCWVESAQPVGSFHETLASLWGFVGF